MSKNLSIWCSHKDIQTVLSAACVMPCKQAYAVSHQRIATGQLLVRVHTYMDLRGRRKSMTVSPLEMSTVTHNKTKGRTKTVHQMHYKSTSRSVASFVIVHTDGPNH